MMSHARSSFVLGLLLGILLSVIVYALVLRQTLSTPVQGANKVLKLAHALDTSHPVHLAMLEMQKKLAHYSHGELTLEIYPNGVLGTEVQSIEQLQQGVLAMTKTSAAAMESFMEEMKVFGLPYLFRDRKHYWQVLDSPLGQEILLTAQEKQLRGLTYFDAGSRSFYATEKNIHTPEDLQGMKIRVMNSPMAMKMITALGGSPTPISWGELYSALAQGIVDGAENNPPTYLSNRHYEVSPFFTLDRHTRIPDLLMISLPIWQSLSGTEQTWLQRAADDASSFQRQLWQEKTDIALHELMQKGVTIVEPNIQLFQDKTRPVYEEFSQTALGKLAANVKAISQ